MTDQAVIYTRLSRFKDDAITIEAQEQDAHAVAKARGLSVLAVCVDHGESAFDRENPEDRAGYADVCDLVRQGKVQYVIAWRNDRLWRDVFAQAMFLRDARRAGLKGIITSYGTIDPSNPDDSLIVQILGAVDEHESAVKQERIRRQKRAARAEHRPTSSVVSFGWLGTRHGHVRNDGLHVCEPEAALLRDAARRVLTGASLTSIAREWNTAGVPMPKDANRGDTAAPRWRPGHIAKMLTNERNAGHQTHRGEVVARNVWPIDGEPIFDADTFDALRVHFGDRKRAPYAHRGKRSPWNGIVRCGGTLADGSPCGLPMSLSGQSAKSPAMFACCGIEGRKACGRCATMRDKLVPVAHSLLVDYADGDELAALLDVRDTDVEAARVQLRAAYDHRDQLKTALDDGTLSPAEYGTARDTTAARIERLSAQLAQATAGSALAPFIGSGHVLADVLASGELTDDEHRALFAASGCYVWVVPAGRGVRFDPARVSFDPVHPALRAPEAARHAA